MIVLVMGVEGSGKTTVGTALAARLGWVFADGDDFHSEANKQKLHAGVPLTDEDRAPWLEAMHQQITRWLQAETSAVLAASALKQSYRERLFAGVEKSAYRIVFLNGTRELLAERLARRTGHFASPAILDSQLATLEAPADGIEISIAQTPESQVEAILRALPRQ